MKPKAKKKTPSKMKPKPRVVLSEKWFTPLDRIMEQYPKCLVAEGFDEAILGMAHAAGDESVIAYDLEECTELMIRQGLNRVDAVKYLKANVLNSDQGPHTPIFIERF